MSDFINGLDKEISVTFQNEWNEKRNHTKRKELDDKKVLKAYHAGEKTADEIVAS